MLCHATEHVNPVKKRKMVAIVANKRAPSPGLGQSDFATSR